MGDDDYERQFAQRTDANDHATYVPHQGPSCFTVTGFATPPSAAVVSVFAYGFGDASLTVLYKYYGNRGGRICEAPRWASRSASPSA